MSRYHRLYHRTTGVGDSTILVSYTFTNCDTCFRIRILQDHDLGQLDAEPAVKKRCQSPHRKANILWKRIPSSNKIRKFGMTVTSQKLDRIRGHGVEGSE
jgi:hypothetical protein